MIREKSIVMVGERDLSACVQEAKDLAYRSAISRIEEAGNALPSSHVEQQTHASTPVTTSNDIADTDDQKQTAQSESPIMPPESPTMQQPAVPATPAPVSQESEDDLPSEDDDSDDQPAQTNGIQRFDLMGGLQPASNLLSNAAAPPPKPDNFVDAALQKALAMPITILGKLHTSFGKTADEILDTDPQCIVDFAHRYTGPKVEEKEALVKLYPEAVRRVQKAA